ncbi:Hint domain-containing protein [Roseomonas aerophila]|uniref:Hint domain-containing protein n=1 Tax=Teichococcus aerophilus TaxID=1224513 RepID=A0ABR7RV05_9PROT|nr:Hint domain-containing protein [Pseudoroseomonas aerophila]MBC9209812.1 Hint domain-containing protein [Pseudoroseomonas aerophila]
MPTQSFLSVYQLNSQNVVVGSATSINVDSGENTNLTSGDIVTMERSGQNFTFEFQYSSGDGFVATLTAGSFPPGDYWFTNTPQPNGTIPENNGNSYYLCFLEGTLIATPSGQVCVETLRIGDTILTQDGKVVPVRWLGRRAVFSRFAPPVQAYPIRIRQGALSENIPARDLYLSPGHALLVDGVLCQAGALVNGTSITRVSEPDEQFTYWHIETEDHTLIMAEGAPAETFVDNVTRRRFDNFAEYQAVFPEERAIAELDYPRALSARQVPPAIRVRLAERAETLGFTKALAA